MGKNRDQALIERCQRGDRRALEELLEKYQRPVYNAAFRMLGNPQDASDITQAVFLKVFEHLGSYDPNYKFFSWIYRIAINESINQFKRARREAQLDESEPSAARGPLEEAAMDANSRRVQGALMTLQEDYRMVVVLRHFTELSYREISEVLHIPEMTVKSRLYTARQQLKEHLSLGNGEQP